MIVSKLRARVIREGLLNPEIHRMSLFSRRALGTLSDFLKVETLTTREWKEDLALRSAALRRA
jgi:hypothetical protein